MHASQVSNCNEIDSLVAPSKEQEQQGVVFSGEADICAVGHAGSASQYLAPETDLQDLTYFFGRPTLISRGNLSSSPGVLYTLSTSWDFFVLEIPFWAERLRGVRGIRGDLVFTVEHNANPFHQGLLVASYQYGDNQFLRGDKPSMCTHLPHVRLNLSDNTAATLTVPYLSEHEYWGSSESEDNFRSGRFFLTQVLPTPLLAGSTTPVFKVYVHLENIQLFGRLPLVEPSFIVPQSGVGSQPRGASAAEKELRDNGKMSGAIATAAMLPKAIGRAFPSISPFMGSVTWFLNASAKAASAFGFSKPTITKEYKGMVRAPNFAEHTCDVPVVASTVGAFQGNTVAVSEALGGTDLDEMAFDTILTRPSQIFRGTLSTADSHGTARYASHVALTHMWFRAPTGVVFPNVPGNRQFPASSTTQLAVIPSTLLYVGQNFRLWNGGFKYTFTFAKSKFHTGRVMVTFIPNYRLARNTAQYSSLGIEGGPVPALFNSDLQPSQYSKIFDFKSGSEFDFEVPYIAPVNHLGFNDTMGFISMQIMDPLVNNGESSSTVSFIVEVAALPGFYFAGVAGPLAPSHADLLDPVIEFQSGVGGSAVDASQHSVGEKFNSLKQLAMTTITRRNFTVTGALDQGIVPHWACVPSWSTDGAPLSGVTQRNWAMSRSGMVAQCYAYGVGSTMLSMDTVSLGASSHVRVLSSLADNNVGIVPLTPASIYQQLTNTPNTSWAGVYRGTTGNLFKLPSLSAAPRFRIGDFNTSIGTRDWSPDNAFDANTTSSTSVKVSYRWAVRNLDGQNRNWYWGVCADDDARCAAYIGPCPMILANSTITNNSWWTITTF